MEDILTFLQPLDSDLYYNKMTQLTYRLSNDLFDKICLNSRSKIKYGFTRNSFDS